MSSFYAQLILGTNSTQANQKKKAEWLNRITILGSENNKETMYSYKSDEKPCPYKNTPFYI